MGNPVSSVTTVFLLWFHHTKIPYVRFQLALLFKSHLIAPLIYNAGSRQSYTG